MLPCNVVVFEEEGGSVVEAVSPMAMLSFVDRPEMESVADEAQARQTAAMDAVAAWAAARAT